MNALIDRPGADLSMRTVYDKLWVYTNYDCNLQCSYCLAESSPRASRREISLDTVQRLVDEAVALGFKGLYFTGGEPFLLDDIYAMLKYASQHLETVVLTNGMLLKGRRLEKLCAVNNENLVVQVSLDGWNALQHDAYRGIGSWALTVQGIHNLREHGFHIRLSTTETPANSDHLEKICAFHLQLGIPEDEHVIRPLAQRGFSQAGMKVSKATLSPELTINHAGAYWHPISTDPDLQISPMIFPLANTLKQLQNELQAIPADTQQELRTLQ